MCMNAAHGSQPEECSHYREIHTSYSPDYRCWVGHCLQNFLKCLMTIQYMSLVIRCILHVWNVSCDTLCIQLLSENAHVHRSVLICAVSSTHAHLLLCTWLCTSLPHLCLQVFVHLVFLSCTWDGIHILGSSCIRVIRVVIMEDGRLLVLVTIIKWVSLSV